MKKVIYLGCPHCDWRQLLSSLTAIKKWNGWKEVHCQQCDTPSDLSEWNWYEKHMVLACERCNAVKSNILTHEEMMYVGQNFIKPKRKKVKGEKANE